ncbi:dihydroorotate dehydrogenase electron transfer subunit [Listeria sp. PSOL-1]|uniref:dihydroorotate dehydrogenase electron transfer subunit n=1 Tax=Listeria sp. PSOL-1 TaxID=1844999 RepID=UPI0013D24521|nr:dihydroorotate dehydrogenase electron transfer subunit [Listeria sp. PSOL-1]
MNQSDMRVIKQTEIASQVYELILSGENIQHMLPGQFLMLKPNRQDLLLRRPISICAYDKAKNECTLLYRALAPGTTSLTYLKEGDKLDTLGPLGNGFDLSAITPNKRYLLIGGGIGVPPMYQLGKELKERGAHVTFVNGFATKQDVFYEKEMATLGDVRITTVDGSYGVRGFVTDVTDTLDFEPERVFSCGPHAMLQAVKANFDTTKTYLSLEERMACGVGACYACVCEKSTPEKDHVKVCSDGPVFRSDEVKL